MALKEIEGIASEGHAGIVLEFDISLRQGSGAGRCREKVSRRAAEMPAEAEEAQIFETNFSLIPTIVVALSGDVPERTLFRKAKDTAG
jgi:multidrug efflux pump